MKRNDTVKMMIERQSCRKFLDKRIDLETIDEILLAGTYAPNAGGAQPWSIACIVRRELLDKIGDLMEEDLRQHMPGFDPANMVEHHGTRGAILFGKGFAPMLVVISEKPGEQTPVVASALCAENMIIAAESYGISSCWLGAVTANLIAPILADPNGDPEIKRLVPEGYRLIGVLAFGYPAEGGFRTPRVPRRGGNVTILA